MKRIMKRFIAAFMAMLTVVIPLISNNITAFAASPQANMKMWYASPRETGEISELKEGYNQGHMFYHWIDGHSAYSLQDNYMIRFPKLIAAAKEKLACVREDIKTRDEEIIKSAEFSITIGKATFTERVDGGTVMLEAISKCKTGDTYHIGEFKGFQLLVEKNYMGTNYMVLRGKTDYKTELSTSPIGNMVKLENTFNAIQSNEEFLLKKIEQYELDMQASKEQYEKPFEYEEELKAKLARQYELNAELDLENEKMEDVNLGNREEERSSLKTIVAEPEIPYRADDYKR